MVDKVDIVPNEEEEELEVEKAPDKDQKEHEDEEYWLSEAIKDGYDPDYKGPNKKRTPKEFVERGREIKGFMKKHLNRSEAEVRRLTKKLESQGKEFEKAISLVEKQVEKEYKKELEKIRSEKAKAVTDADGAKYKELDDQEQRLREEHQTLKDNKVDPSKVEDIRLEDDPVMAKWAEDNPWIYDDEELSEYAGMYGQFLRRTKPTLQGKKFLDAVADGVKEKFPEKFNNPRRKGTAVSEPKNNGARKKDDKTFDSLPADAKQAYQTIIRSSARLKDYTKEDYAKDYFAEEANA